MKGETSLTKKLSPGRVGPILRAVAPRLCFCVYMYVCWPLPAGLLPLCDPGKHAQSDSDKHTKHPPITVLLACSLLNPVWLLGAGGWCIVVWPQPDKAAAPLLFYLSVITHLHASVYPCTHLTHRLPSTNTCSPPNNVYAWRPECWLVCAFVPAHIASLLIPSPQHWPLPRRSVCMRVHVCLCFVRLIKRFSKPHVFALFQTQLHSIVCFETKIHVHWYLFVWFYFFCGLDFFFSHWLYLQIDDGQKCVLEKLHFQTAQKVLALLFVPPKKKKYPLRDRN